MTKCLKAISQNLSNMRSIKYIVCHCTATSLNTKVESIVRYWKKKLGWKNPGYHYIIDRFGKVTQLQPIELPSNGVRGWNKNSIHISTIGGKHEDDRTSKQKIALNALLKTLNSVFPKAEIKGHRDFPGVTKSCPRYNAKDYWNSINE